MPFMDYQHFAVVSFRTEKQGIQNVWQVCSSGLAEGLVLITHGTRHRPLPAPRSSPSLGGRTAQGHISSQADSQRKKHCFQMCLLGTSIPRVCSRGPRPTLPHLCPWPSMLKPFLACPQSTPHRCFLKVHKRCISWQHK